MYGIFGDEGSGKEIVYFDFSFFKAGLSPVSVTVFVTESVEVYA